MKKLLLIATGLLFLTGCGQRSTKVGAGEKIIIDQVQLTNDLATVDQEVAVSAKIQPDGNYPIIGETSLSDGTKYRIDSIVQWLGEGKGKNVGYQVTVTRADGATKSYGSGMLNGYFDHDWQLPPVEINSTTP